MLPTGARIKDSVRLHHIITGLRTSGDKLEETEIDRHPGGLLISGETRVFEYACCVVKHAWLARDLLE